MRQYPVVQMGCLISIELRQWVDGGVIVIKEYTTGLTVTVLTIALQFVMTADTFCILLAYYIDWFVCPVSAVRAGHSAVCC